MWGAQRANGARTAHLGNDGLPVLRGSYLGGRQILQLAHFIVDKTAEEPNVLQHGSPGERAGTQKKPGQQHAGISKHLP